MGRPTGSADLPLHGGRVPAWLASRMARLGRLIAESARTVEALALVAEVVHGAPSRFRDPARFSYAHGGKDGHPFPVPLRVYDKTIQVLKHAVGRARLGEDNRLAALRELDRQARAVEGAATGRPLDELFARERRRAADYGGRTVQDDRRPPPNGRQLELPGV
jgi:uncharacterized protein